MSTLPRPPRGRRASGSGHAPARLERGRQVGSAPGTVRSGSARTGRRGAEGKAAARGREALGAGVHRMKRARRGRVPVRQVRGSARRWRPAALEHHGQDSSRLARERHDEPAGRSAPRDAERGQGRGVVRGITAAPVRPARGPSLRSGRFVRSAAWGRRDRRAFVRGPRGSQTCGRGRRVGPAMDAHMPPGMPRMPDARALRRAAGCRRGEQGEEAEHESGKQPAGITEARRAFETGDHAWAAIRNQLVSRPPVEIRISVPSVGAGCVTLRTTLLFATARCAGAGAGAGAARRTAATRSADRTSARIVVPATVGTRRAFGTQDSVAREHAPQSFTGAHVFGSACAVETSANRAAPMARVGRTKGRRCFTSRSSSTGCPIRERHAAVPSRETIRLPCGKASSLGQA